MYLEDDYTILSDTTDILSPGVIYSRSPDTLFIPAIKDYAEEVIAYRVYEVGSDIVIDSCKTIITYEAPVAIAISAFTGRLLEDAVELEWDIDANETIVGFDIFRKGENDGLYRVLNVSSHLQPVVRKYTDKDISPGRNYQYALCVLGPDGSEVRSRELSVQTKVYELALYQNHPNPFNPSTIISFTLPKRANTSLSIYNIEGKLVKTLVNETLEAGYKQVTWNGTDAKGNAVSSGVYFYRLKAGGKVLTRKMVVIK